MKVETPPPLTLAFCLKEKYLSVNVEAVIRVCESEQSRRGPDLSPQAPPPWDELSIRGVASWVGSPLDVRSVASWVGSPLGREERLLWSDG